MPVTTEQEKNSLPLFSLQSMTGAADGDVQYHTGWFILDLDNRHKGHPLPNRDAIQDVLGESEYTSKTYQTFKGVHLLVYVPVRANLDKASHRTVHRTLREFYQSFFPYEEWPVLKFDPAMENIGRRTFRHGAGGTFREYPATGFLSPGTRHELFVQIHGRNCMVRPEEADDILRLLNNALEEPWPHRDIENLIRRGNEQWKPASSKQKEARDTLHSEPEVDKSKLTSRDRVAMRTFAMLDELIGDELITNELTRQIEYAGERLQDSDIRVIQARGVKEKGMWAPTEEIRAWMDQQALERGYHPVRDWLKQVVPLESIPPISRNLFNNIPPHEHEWCDAVMTTLLKAAVAVPLQPGTIFELMPVIKGGQGVGKTRLCKIIADGTLDHGTTPTRHLSASHIGVFSDSKWLLEQADASTVIEVAEMKAFRKADKQDRKEAISRHVEVARTAYARLPTRRERWFVLVGTTNDQTFLDDRENRRYLIIDLGDEGTIDIEWAEAYIPRIMATFYREFEANGYPRVVELPQEMWELQEAKNKNHIVHDFTLQDVVDQLTEEHGDTWCLKSSDIRDHLTQRGIRMSALHISEQMQLLGVRRLRKRFGGPPVNIYAKEGIETSELKLVEDLSSFLYPFSE